jgi:hypothetical protein
MNNKIDTELLIQYLDGELEGDTLEEVRMRITNDPSLSHELENLRSAQQVVKGYGLRQEISNIHLEMMRELKSQQTKKAPVITMVKKVFRVAASIIVIAGLISFIQYVNLSSRKLFESAFQSYVPPATRGSGDHSNLEEFYKQHQMGKVADSFAVMNNPSVKDYFYAANASLAEHNASKAIKLFRSAERKNVQMGTHIFEDDTEYYLAMSFLENNRPAEALPLFEKIHSEKQHLYNDKVSKWFLFKLKLLALK